jgi:protocatechuate 3,4-dioxygenase beta subunit
METRSERGSRRVFLIASLSVGAAWAAGLVSRARAATACGGEGAVTPRQTEGPYFKPNSPARASLIEPGMPGTRLVVEGSVLTADCKPVPRALLDFWQADAAGRYDNEGQRLRGHQLTDDAGHYRLETVVPAQYPGRTRHIHVKVQAPGRPALTTQLYFPGESANQRDGIFDPKLVMKVRDVDGGKIGAFDFVLRGG